MFKHGRGDRRIRSPLQFNVVMVVKAKTKDACGGIGGGTCDPGWGEGEGSEESLGRRHI